AAGEELVDGPAAVVVQVAGAGAAHLGGGDARLARGPRAAVPGDPVAALLVVDPHLLAPHARQLDRPAGAPHHGAVGLHHAHHEHLLAAADHVPQGLEHLPDEPVLV